MFQGSCLCERVSFRVTSAFQAIGKCHCDICSSSHGADHATQGLVPDDSFELTAGSDCITSFESSPGYLRCFCKICGSRLFNRHLTYGFHSVALNALIGNPDLEPAFHTYVKSKRSWVSLMDDYPKFEELPS